MVVCSKCNDYKGLIATVDGDYYCNFCDTLYVKEEKREIVLSNDVDKPSN